MYLHRIRLRGPWHCEPLARTGPPEDAPLPPRRQAIMPCRWGQAGLEGFVGRVRFRRHFGWPGRIDPQERVWLTFAGVEGTAEVRLNERFLGRFEGAAPFELEVTSLLQARNCLTVEVEAANEDGGLWGEVALEVRCLAFLRGVRWWTTAEGEGVRLHVAGEVVGICGRPLELYVLLDNRTILYHVLEAAPAGKAFQATADAIPLEETTRPREVRVELVNGASVWYAVEGMLNNRPV
jgi:hypothetical protein